MILVVNTDNRVDTLAIATVDNLSLTLSQSPLSTISASLSAPTNDTVNLLAVALSPLTAST